CRVDAPGQRSQSGAVSALCQGGGRGQHARLVGGGGGGQRGGGQGVRHGGGGDQAVRDPVRVGRGGVEAAHVRHLGAGQGQQPRGGEQVAPDRFQARAGLPLGLAHLAARVGESSRGQGAHLLGGVPGCAAGLPGSGPQGAGGGGGGDRPVVAGQRQRGRGRAQVGQPALPQHAVGGHGQADLLGDLGGQGRGGVGVCVQDVPGDGGDAGRIPAALHHEECALLVSDDRADAGSAAVVRGDHHRV